MTALWRLIAHDRCDPRCEPTPAALGIERAAYLIHGGIWILEAESEEAAARLVQTLSGRRAVAAVRRNHLLHAHQVPNDPLLLPLQWPLQQMEAANPNGTGAWSVTIGSTTIKVAIIDSGMQLDHPDLEQNVLLNDREAAVAAPSPAPGGPQQQRQDSRACSDGVDTDGNGYVDDCFGYNFLEDSSNVYDGHRHGTFLAGVVGAVGDDAVGVAGVAPQVSLLPLKIFAHGSCLASPRGGSYAVTGADSAARAANYALLRGANVSLMAFGFDCTVPQTFLAHQPASVAGRSSGSNSSGGSSNSSVGDGTGGVGSSLMMRDAPFFAGGRMVKLPEAECLFPFQDLARSASLAGQLWVMAAGNSASNNDAQPHSPSNVRGTNVLAVASTDPLDELAPSSNTGRGSVHLAAPGTSVFSTVPDYVDCGDLAQRGVGVMSGTSVAAAHVAGVAVLVASVLEACGPRRYSAPQDRAAAVRNAILASVEQVPALMNSTVSGGRVSARGAVEYAVRNFCESEQSSGSQDDAPAEADGFAGEAQQGGSQGAELPGNAGSGENGSGLTAGASPAAAAPNAAGRDDDVLLGAPDDNASFDEDFLEDDIFWQDFDQQFAADERGKR